MEPRLTDNRQPRFWGFFAMGQKLPNWICKGLALGAQATTQRLPSSFSGPRAAGASQRRRILSASAQRRLLPQVGAGRRQELGGLEMRLVFGWAAVSMILAVVFAEERLISLDGDPPEFAGMAA